MYIDCIHVAAAGQSILKHLATCGDEVWDNIYSQSSSTKLSYSLFIAVCPEGKEYQECGPACPLTCENYDFPVIDCVNPCVPGCFCPAGLAEFRGECVDPAECPVLLSK